MTAPKRKVVKKYSANRKLYLSNTKSRAKITARMRFLVQDAGGVTAFGRVHSVSPKYVYHWYSEGMVPSTDYLIKFALAGISPDWLLLGKGQPYTYFHKTATTATKGATS